MNKKLYIFDFDGTLVDTFTDAGIYYNKALEQFGFNPHKLEEYKFLLGGSLEEVVTRILPEDSRTKVNIENVKNHYWSNYPNSKKENTKLYSGIYDFLIELTEKKIKVAINTNKKQEMVTRMCDELLPNIQFDCIAGNCDKYLPKPDSGGIDYILNKCNVSKNECVYIGDSKVDAETAKNAGIDLILVKWGSYNFSCKDYDNIRFIADTVEDLKNYLFSI